MKNKLSALFKYFRSVFFKEKKTTPVRNRAWCGVALNLQTEQLAEKNIRIQNLEG